MTLDSKTIIFFCILNFVIPTTYEITYENYNSKSLNVQPRTMTKEEEKEKNIWCTFECYGVTRKSVVCEHWGKCFPEKPCISVSLDEKKVLEVHNKLRRKFASGHEKLAGGIRVADMKELHWDKGLARSATCSFTEYQCKDLPPSPVKECLGAPWSWGSIGRNILNFKSKSPKADCACEALNGILGWYNELEKASSEELQRNANSYNFKEDTKQFSQIVWANTSRVGCAMTARHDGQGTDCYLICHYNPGGNIIGQRAYAMGRPCSKCNGKCRWGLCERSLVRSSDRPLTRVNISIKLLMILSIFLAQVE